MICVELYSIVWHIPAQDRERETGNCVGSNRRTKETRAVWVCLISAKCSVLGNGKPGHIRLSDRAHAQSVHNFLFIAKIWTWRSSIPAKRINCVVLGSRHRCVTKCRNHGYRRPVTLRSSGHYDTLSSSRVQTSRPCHDCKYKCCDEGVSTAVCVLHDGPTSRIAVQSASGCNNLHCWYLATDQCFTRQATISDTAFTQSFKID
jgi:hypothetical protein